MADTNELLERLERAGKLELLEERAMPSSTELLRFEERYGLCLPADYRWFLGRFGGSVLENCCFRADVPSVWADRAGRDGIDAFYGLGSCEYDLDEAMESHGHLPGVMPIAEAPGGSLICLGLEGNERGRVFFWDQEGDVQDEGNGFTLISDSLSEFLLRLEPDEDPKDRAKAVEIWLADDLLAD